MNQLINFEFSEFSLLTVLIIGILISFVLGLIRKIIIPKFTKIRLKQLYRIVEIFIWIVFGFWALHLLLKDSMYYMLAVLAISALIVIWLGWFVVRDFIAGIVLQLGDNYEVGQHFRLGDIQGTIVETDYLQLSIRQRDGAIVKIPYSKISGSIHYKSVSEDQANRVFFDLELPKEKSVDEFRQKIREAIFLSVGSCSKKEPKIDLKEETDKTWKFEVTAYTLSPEYTRLVENNVRKVLN